MKKKVAVFMLFGQSNATGHGIPMREEDYISEPMKNVWGLNRDPNQSFDSDHLEFTGYTSHGMNLAETQDNTYSVANCLARLWQDAIDGGETLPDLYVIQISIGSQGVYDMWWPDREKKLIPGVHGTADISMYPLTVHVLELMKRHFDQNGIEPDFIGMHWRGGEQEVRRPIPELEGKLKATYLRIFNGMREAMGHEFPIVLHLMPYVEVFTKEGNVDTMHYINGLFEELAREMPKTTLFDPRRAPWYGEPYVFYRWDLIHYSEKTNRWVAEQIFEEYKSR